MEIASRVAPVLPFSICCVWAQEFCSRQDRGSHRARQKEWKREESDGERRDWGEKAHLKWRRSWVEEREAGKGEQWHSFSSQAGAIELQSQGGRLLVPCVPRLDSLGSDSSHETTTSSCCSPSPSLPSLWHGFTALFSQGDVPKVQNLELEQWRGGVMGQQVPARPLSARPQTLHLPSLLPTPPEHKQSLSNQKWGCLLQPAPERQI